MELGGNKRATASPVAQIIANNRGNGIHSAPQRYEHLPLDYIRGRITCNDPNEYFQKVMDAHPGIQVKTFFKGDELTRESIDHQNMKITKHEAGTIRIEGSLHKYWNKGGHNADQFTAHGMREVVQRLSQELHLLPESIYLTQVEYGVNLLPPIPCHEIIDRCFQHRGRDFETVISSQRGKYHRCEHTNYTLKIYDKAKQYGTSDEILRFEIKTTNWSSYRAMGIVTLQDLLTADKENFIDGLLARWDEIVFADPTTVYPEKWDKFTNKEYWREIRNGDRRHFYQQRKKLKKLNTAHGQNIQGMLADQMRDTLRQLKNATFSTFKEIRVCRVTGIPIENQRQNSFLLSHTGIKYIHRNDPKTFERVRYAFLTQKWKNEPLETQIKEIAHNIRNKYSNQKRNSYEVKNPNQLQLTLKY